MLFKLWWLLRGFKDLLLFKEIIGIKKEKKRKEKKLVKKKICVGNWDILFYNENLGCIFFL